jgi:hypothetical protein
MVELKKATGDTLEFQKVCTCSKLTFSVMLSYSILFIILIWQDKCSPAPAIVAQNFERASSLSVWRNYSSFLFPECHFCFFFVYSSTRISLTH